MTEAPCGGIGADLAVVLPAVLAELAPRVRVEPGRVWVDARGLAARELAEQLLESLATLGVEGARAGVSEVAMAAWAACSRYGPVANGAYGADGMGEADADGRAGSVFVVPAGDERAYLAAFPLGVLELEGADARVLGMLADVGVQTCGELGALEREVVEVRFGAEGVRLWRLARADDGRLLFLPSPPELPQASLDFLDYVVTDPERLAFTVNALLGSVCDALRERGQHARRMLLVLELADGTRWEQGLRPGRPTGSRAAWLRLARAALERSTLSDAVTAVRLEVEAVEGAGVRQGDLFDAGFATAPAVEAAVLRLVEAQGEVVVQPEVNAHPLPERRVAWAPAPLDAVSATAVAAPQTRPDAQADSASSAEPAVASGVGAARRSWAAGRPQAHTPERFVPDAAAATAAVLTLQLLQQPRPILVETVLRRDHQVPIRYRDVRSGGADSAGAGPAADGRWRQLENVAGPDRVSGGVWEEAFAREYFRALTTDGALVWLFRDARRDAWYLHGWWD